MFSAVLLAHEDSSKGIIEDLALASRQVSLERTLYRFPQPHALAQLLNGIDPDLVFLDLSEWDIAMEATTFIRETAPKAGIIGFGGGWNTERLAQGLALGVSSLLMAPVTVATLLEAVDLAIHKVRGGIQENLIAFLPSKAGSGATTIAVNAAGYLAAAGRRVLLIDADLNSGVIGLLLDRKHDYTLRDALAESTKLDYSAWTRFITRKLNFDMLLSEHKRRLPLPSWVSYHHLLDFAAPRYDHVLIDLPEVTNDATVETVRRAKQVYLVCTPEIPSLALAPQRIDELTNRGIPADKIQLLVNRWHRTDSPAPDIESMLGRHVAGVFGNDYTAASGAARAGNIVGGGTALGRAYAQFARKLMGQPDAPPRGALAFLKGLGSKALHPARA